MTDERGPMNAHALYSKWRSMRKRCNIENNSTVYGIYKGRGIQVCDRWRNSFWDFVDDVGEPPGPGYTLDRINNNEGYYPGNVRWATWHQQNRNRRSTKLDSGKVRQVRFLRRLGFSQSEIGTVFGVQQPCVWKICNGRRWGDV